MLQIQVVERNNLKQNTSVSKFRFLDFIGNFYSLKCAATSMNHSAFQWVEIATLFGGRGAIGLGWAGQGRAGQLQTFTMKTIKINVSPNYHQI